MLLEGSPLALMGFGAARSNPAVAQLQRAVQILGVARQDQGFMIATDGIMGPATARTVNKALRTYATTAPRALRTGSLTQAQILANIGPITNAIAAAANAVPTAKPSAKPSSQYLDRMAQEIASRVPSAQVTRVTPGGARPVTGAPTRAQIQTLQQTVGVKADGVVGPKTIAAVSKAAGRPVSRAELSNASTVVALTSAIAARGPRTGAPVVIKMRPAKSTGVAALQASLRKLGSAVGNRSLLIAADGIAGPKTAAAVNLALVRYVPAAPAQYKTGRLTVADVQTQALTFKTIIDAEVTRRGARAPTVPRTPGGTPAVSDLQRALDKLASVAQDRALLVTVDGRTGPKTAASANRALAKHVKNVPRQLKATLTPPQVAAMAPTITGLINQELQRRGSAPVIPGPPEVAAQDHAEATAAVETPVPSEAPEEPTAPEPAAAPVPTRTALRPTPTPTPSAEEEPAAAAPSPAFPSAATAAMIPSAPGAMAPGAEPGGGEGAPAPEGGEEPKKFPWVPVAIGGGVLLAGIGAFVIASRRKKRR